MPQKSLNEYKIAIYNSNVTVSTTFWDWRHRVLTLYLSIVTAAGGIVAWLYQKDLHQAYVGLPLVFASESVL
jgi:heme A synthase